MADLIDRQALIAEIKRIGGHPYSDWETAGVLSLVARISNIETEPVKHGRWSGWKNAHCSECGCFCTLAYIKDYPNYCPNCGAKMTEGE